jgi:hypothetical protein
MNIVFHEMKKIWNLKILLVIALLCTLYYSIFLSFQIEHFPNGHPMTEDVGYSMELLQRYGLTLEEDEYAEFVQETRAKLIAEMEKHIKSNPVFAAAGIFSYEDYERLRVRNQLTEAENIAYWTLLGEESGFARFKMQALEWIESHYHHYPQYTLPILMSEAANQKERDRLAAIMETGEYRNIMNWLGIGWNRKRISGRFQRWLGRAVRRAVPAAACRPRRRDKPGEGGATVKIVVTEWIWLNGLERLAGKENEPVYDPGSDSHPVS